MSLLRTLPGTLVAAGLALIALGAAATHGQSAWYEGFEGSAPSWQPAGGDSQPYLERQERVAGEAHTGQRCERLTIRAGYGTTAYFAHNVGRPLVIDELLPTVWIKSDRGGLQLLAHVVLPHSANPQTGQPLFVLIPGSLYKTPGGWEQLRVVDVPRLLARQLHVLRAQFGPSVDQRGAYVERVVLNVYGGPGITNVWIDDLDIAGYVARPASPWDSAATLTGSQRGVSGGLADRSGPAPGDPAAPGLGATALGRPEPPKTALVGSVLLAAGRPLFPRIIQYQGEPPEFLSRLGFNTLWLSQPPSPSLLAEAERLQLWIVCPPPFPMPGRPGAADGPAAAGVSDIGPDRDRVLAWDLGQRLTAGQLDSVRPWAEQIRAADRRRGRPLIAQPDSGLRGYSRATDLLLLSRPVLGGSLEMREFGVWLRDRQLLAQPGTSVWASVQTQLPPEMAQQLDVLYPGRPVPREVSREQIRLMAYTALSAGCRGLLFESQSPLTLNDGETRYRAMALELLNLELALIQSWVARGALLSCVGGNTPEVMGAVLWTDQAQLVLPLWSSPGAACVMDQSAGNSVTLVVPAAPEACKTNELLPGGLRTLLHRRGLGGVQVTMDEFGPVSQIVLTQNPLIIDSLSRQASACGQRASELQRQLAAYEFQRMQQVMAEIDGRAAIGKHTAQRLATARRDLLECDELLHNREFQAAYLAAERATRTVRLIQRSYWDLAIKRLVTPASSPASAGFELLPWQWRLIAAIIASQPGPNRLPGGDFEDLAGTLGVGWQYFPQSVEGVQSRAELVPEAAHTGLRGMRLTVWPRDPKLPPPAAIETPPIWLTTPPVPVEAGTILRIHGWVKLPGPPAGTTDGLLILDSIAGPGQVERIRETIGWREFSLYRAAVRAEPLTVSFGLSGLGSALLDDISVEALQPLAGRSVTQPPAGASPVW